MSEADIYKLVDEFDIALRGLYKATGLDESTILDVAKGDYGSGMADRLCRLVDLVREQKERLGREENASS